MIRETIRLTELERLVRAVRIKVEGDLHQINCHVLINRIKAYAQADILDIHLVISHVQSIDHTTRDKLLELANDGLHIRLHQPPTFLASQLKIWGMADWIEE